VGTVIAPVLGSYVFFKHTGDNTDSLKTVQWVYLAIAVFVFVLAIVFYFSPIPEVRTARSTMQSGY
jgi:FHS family L-fucose permease-like MFS transporter